MKKMICMFLLVACLGVPLAMTSCSDDTAAGAKEPEKVQEEAKLSNPGEKLAEKVIVAMEKGDVKAVEGLEKELEALSAEDQKAAKAYFEKNNERFEKAQEAAARAELSKPAN